MLYLSGSKNKAIADDLAAGAIGLLQTPSSNYVLSGVKVWALDNGCFTNSYPGDEKYLKLLEKHDDHRDRCLFVAIPDVVGDGEATLAQFQPLAATIRDQGWPVALVAQDGMLPWEVPWTEVDWLFIGGSTDWKMGPSAAALVVEATARGVRVHVGRVNSWRRFHYFAGLDCDTADGTIIALGRRRTFLVSGVGGPSAFRGCCSESDPYWSNPKTRPLTPVG